MKKTEFKFSEESRKLMAEAQRRRFGPVADRFWSRVKKNINKGCYVWLGDTYPDGYGRFWANGRNYRANRFVWELVNGPIPEGLHVLHTCDNPLCVKPKHLFLGTPRNNIDDMLEKGRSRKGENHVRSKLTEAQAIEVLQWECGCGERLYQMAARMGVSPITLEQIRSGKNWKHLYHHHSKFKNKS